MAPKKAPPPGLWYEPPAAQTGASFGRLDEQTFHRILDMVDPEQAWGHRVGTWRIPWVCREWRRICRERLERSGEAVAHSHRLDDRSP